jgi:hypothetical protein
MARWPVTEAREEKAEEEEKNHIHQTPRCIPGRHGEAVPARPNRRGRTGAAEGSCGDPGLPIRNTRYAYNSRSHDQCVVNPHIRVNNRITSSFTVPNNILTIGHMTKYDIATQGKFTIKQRIPSSVDDPRHAYYPTGN